ncbi:terpene synthase family protein [Streptomyces luteolus]|uniref:Terpene synthase n=1 Tax=Streptomyces luteolus TaxID=3043615 RepID=A0ABT6T803_9ACTN|nr:hypothetical protein [Streptomyces sp. B-S-A12]MDI3424005.1 hypothetical protein [Streptomyces sp. B-S-A12]
MPERRFTIPFERRVSPDLDSARTQHSRWVRQIGLLRTGQARALHESWDVARMVGGFLPDARGERLDVCVDWNCAALVMDDQFDAGPLGWDAPASVCALQGLAEAFYLPDAPCGAPGLHPLVRAFADVMRRLRALMSPAWCARFAQHNLQGLAGFLDEVTDRTGPAQDMGWEDFLEVRRASGYMFIEIDFIEVAQGYEVPAVLYGCKPMRTMRQCVLDLGVIHNDVYALGKERGRGETLKFTEVLKQHHGCGEEQAIGHSQRLNDEAVHTFLAAKEDLMALLVRLELPEADRKGTARFVSGMEHVISGVHDLHLESARYTDDGRFPLDGAGYVDDQHLAAAYHRGQRSRTTSGVGRARGHGL